MFGLIQYREQLLNKVVLFCVCGVCRYTEACCVCTVMQQQGKIYDSAGAFWQKKCCVTIAGRRWGPFSIPEQVCRLSHSAAVTRCGYACKSGTMGNLESTCTWWGCKYPSMTLHILCWPMWSARCKWENMHLIMLPLMHCQKKWFWFCQKTIT